MNKINRWEPIINLWLEKFPELKLTDQQYKDLEDRITSYGGDQFSDGYDAGYNSAGREE